MSMRTGIYDSAQQALGFVVSELSNISAEVYRTKYADITYQDLVPIETSGNPWAKSSTMFIINSVGKADWWTAQAKDIPLADINRDKREQVNEMAAIGYRFDGEEVATGGMVNLNVISEKALAAKRAAEEFMEVLTWTGDTRKDVTGLINSPLVTRTDAIQDGSGSGAARALWANKTAEQQVRDFDSQLVQIYSGSLGIEMADTVLLPMERIRTLGRTYFTGGALTALQSIKTNNTYTDTTGKPLTIRAVNGLLTAGSGGTARMVAYRYDRQVLQLTVPMPHRFDAPFQTGPITFDVPGYLRTGGVWIKRPATFSYLDGI